MIPLNGRIIARSESWKQVRNSGVSRPSRPVRVMAPGGGNMLGLTKKNMNYIYIYYILYIYIIYIYILYIIYYIYMLPPQKKNSPVFMLTMIIVSTIDVTRVHP